MIDREHWGLRGPVHTCRIEHTWYSRRWGVDAREAQEHGDINVLEFRTDGALLRQQYRNLNSSEWKSTREYDDAG